ncbi:hypothetical protein [Thiothrix winogradskyi]|uniref:SH3b domain-containing protein n=1 Tax=Thiothrix winogradskyi TaxID=96472 RepID=A0ABY3SXB1_9GAMM|nr:hypothetical protein [Thiothrix winogradskyi]UJS23453.1 hypothetical protein L2Y54_16080 [Thiothrix winogradskyi]
MATARYTVKGGRREQMKRELIGLVIGTTLLMAGMAFLFSQSIVASSTSDTSTKIAEAPSVAKLPEPAASPAVSEQATTPVAPASSPSVAAVADQAEPETTAVTVPALAALTVPQPEIPEKAPATPATPAEASEKIIEASTTPTEPDSSSTTVATGWIYAGQFTNGKWSEQGLKIGAELPVSGAKYALTWGATVRENPPGKRSEGGGKLSKSLGNLAPGREIEIVQVKKSGSKGHIWLEIKYQ